VGVKENGTWINGCRYDNLTVAKITESCPVNLPANADGTYVVTVYAFDSAGNESDWQQRTITVDNTPPVVAITAPASGDTLRGTVTVSGTVTDVNPGHYYFVVKNSTGTVVAGPGVVHKPQVASWQWDTTKVADGTYTIDLEARDAANNKGAASTQTISVTVDNTAPTAAITSPTIDQVITGTSLAITGTATDSNFGYYTYVVEDNKQVPLAPAVTVNTPVVAGQLGTWDISSLNNGSYYAVLTVFDKAGNQSSVTQHFTINNNQGGQGGAGGNGGQGGLQGGTGGQGGQADFLTPHVLGASINTSNGQVLGDSTTTPNNTTGTSGSTSGNGDSGNVKGDSINLTNNSNNKSANGKNSNFLGLGWWWLPILAVIIVFFLIVFRRSNSNENQKA
ncbi:MAG TPA: Ig-like domain-containing protein, partial [Candidatus Saccharimonadales bacterium]